MITERTIINTLIIGAGLIFAPFLITATLTGNSWPGILSVSFFFLVLAFCLLQDRLSMLPFLGIFIVGNLNFLPVQLTALNVSCLILIIYYLTTYIVLRRTAVRRGLNAITIPIVIIASIMLYHDHSFGVSVMGGDTEGTRAAMMCIVAVVAYFCGINVSSPPLSFMKNLLFWALFCTMLSTLPFVITTFIPGLAPYFYSLTDTVNVDAYVDSVLGTDNGSARLGVFAGIGCALQLILISYFPISTWWRPNRWWVAILSLICLFLTLEGGFRNILFSFTFATLVGAWCYSSWRAFFLPVAVLVASLVVTTASSNNLIHVPYDKLPLITQRTLSFLPGDWDSRAVESGNSSNEFRLNIQRVYLDEYASKSPLFGNGASVNIKEYTDLIEASKSNSADRYLDAKVFITAKLFHTGWISVYDEVGIVGSLAFVILGINQILIVGSHIVGRKANRKSPFFPIFVWLLCNLVTTMISFFTVFGDFTATFQNLCVYGIVVSHFCNLADTADA